EPRAEVKQLARSTEARSQQRTGEQHRERLEGEGHRRPHDRHGQSGSERRQNGKADDTHDAGDTRGGKDVQPLRDSAGATLHAFCSRSGWWILCPSNSIRSFPLDRKGYRVASAEAEGGEPGR